MRERGTATNEISGISLFQPSGTQWTSRIDHQFTGSDTLTASVFVHHQRSLETPLTPIGTVWEEPENGQNLALRYTSRLSPEIINSATFGRTWWIGEFIQTGKLLNPDLTGLGYNLHPQTSGPTGLPNVQFESTSFDPFGGRYRHEVVTYHWKDDLALARGAHALKLGGEVRWGRANYLESFNAAPFFTFSGANPDGSGNDIADFLLGIPATYEQGTDADGQGSRVSTGLYIWTLSFQRELPGHAVLELAYVGNRSLRLLRQYEANPGLLTPGANVFNVNERRPYRDFDAITVFTSDGTSIYHGFQASLAQRLARGLSGNAR